MTLIVGIKADDGVVVGADSAATYGFLGGTTIRQETKKLEIIKGSVIIGTSGPVGLAQRFMGELTTLWDGNKFSGKKSYEAGPLIKAAFWKHAEQEQQSAATSVKIIGQAALNSSICYALVALPLSKQPCLLQFDYQCAPEEATSKLPFVAIGSGQPCADPFLAFLRRIFWNNKAPSLNEAIFASVWALQHAIQTMPGGVSGPVQVAVLERHGGNLAARELSPEELQEHYGAIDAAEKKLADFRKDLMPQPGDETQIPPKP